MVHETTHVVQAYRRGARPGWLVEGISDYIRFFKFEPGKLGSDQCPRRPTTTAVIGSRPRSWPT